MNPQNVLIRKVLPVLLLVSILILAFYLSSIPHGGYPYPVHIDEWIDLAISNQIITEQSVLGTEPFYGVEPIGKQVLEVGFHTLWAIFHQISNLDWLDVYKYFPSFIFMMTVLSVYILARRLGFGWEAALLSCLMPTTVGILGPGFLVAIGLALTFMALSLFVALNLKNYAGYAILFLFAVFFLVLHVATLVGLIIILAPYIILNLKGQAKLSLFLLLALVLPFILAIVIFPYIWDVLIIPTIKTLFVQKPMSEYILIPDIISTYGYIPILLAVVGAFILILQKGTANYSLVLGLVCMQVMLTVYIIWGYGTRLLFERGLHYDMLILGIIAGAGLMAIKEVKLPYRLTPRFNKLPFLRNAGYVLCLGIIITMLCFAIPARQNTQYYIMIDEQDYQAFTWIKDNVDSRYNKALLDPWKGAPFTAVTGKQVYSFIWERPYENDEKAYDFLSDNATDTAFLVDNNISIVYSRGKVNNPDLVKVREFVYVLK